jgi:hypothetical protein
MYGKAGRPVGGGQASRGGGGRGGREPGGRGERHKDRPYHKSTLPGDKEHTYELRIINLTEMDPIIGFLRWILELDPDPVYYFL